MRSRDLRLFAQDQYIFLAGEEGTGVSIVVAAVDSDPRAHTEIVKHLLVGQANAGVQSSC